MAAWRIGGAAAWLVAASSLACWRLQAQSPAAGATFDLRGTCVDHGNDEGLAGVRVRLLWSALARGAI